MASRHAPLDTGGRRRCVRGSAIASRERRDERAIGVGAERAGERAECPLSDAAAAVRRRSALGMITAKSGSQPQNGQWPSSTPTIPLHQCAAHRARNSRARAPAPDRGLAARLARVRRISVVGARRRAMPFRDERFERVPAARADRSCSVASSASKRRRISAV